jgi:hypothetical protein
VSQEEATGSGWFLGQPGLGEDGELRQVVVVVEQGVELDAALCLT